MFGGGTDFRDYFAHNGGRVINCAIDKYVYVMVNKSFDSRVRVSYSKTEVVHTVNELEHDLIREALKMYNIHDGIEVVTIADVPSNGTGLGSSSALAVGLIAALSRYTGETNKELSLGQEQLALKACELEIDILKKPIGEQDQYGCALPGMKYIIWNEIGVSKILAAPDEWLRDYALLFYTGISRDANAILTKQKENIGRNHRLLSDMEEITRQAYKNMKYGDYDCLPIRLQDAWYTKARLADGITTPLVDSYIERLFNAAVIGAKMLGAGGGGFMFVLAEPKFHGEIIEILKDFRRIPFSVDNQGVVTKEI